MKALNRTVTNWVRGLPPMAILALGLAYVLVLGIVDRAAPRSMSFAPLYLLGIAFVAWGAGRWPATVVSVATAAEILLVQWALMGDPSREWIVLWNASARLLIFTAAGWLTAEITRLTRHLGHMVERRTTQWKTEAEKHKATAARLAEALQQSEERELRYRALLATAMDGFAMVDSAGHIVDVNEAYCRMLGYPREELLGMRIAQIDVQESAKEATTQIAYLVRNGGNRFETRQRCKDGRVLDIEASVSCAPGKEGPFITFVRDITERKRAEAALRESEERYRSLAESFPDAILTLDQATRIQYANSAAAVSLDCTPKNLIGRSQAEIFPPAIAQHHSDLIAQVFATGEGLRLDERLPLPAGERWIDCRIVPVRSPQNRVASVIVVAADITERKQAEQQLTEALELNRTLLAASPVGIGVYKASGECLVANEALARITGGSVEQLLRQNFHQLDSWRRNGVFQHAEEALRLRQPRQVENHITTTFGREVFISFHLVPFVNQGEWHLLAMFNDITEQKRAEEALRQSEERYRTLAESSPDEIFILDRDLRLEYLNSSTAATWGRPAKDLIGIPHSNLFPPETVRQHAEQVKRVFETRAAVRWDELVRFPGGERWLDVRLVPVPGESRQVASVMGISRDITERKRTEQQLAETLELNQKILAVSTVGISAYKASGECIFANEALARIVGGSVEQILQNKFHHLDSWRESGLLRQAEEALREGQARSGEFYGTSPFGVTHWLDCQVIPFTNGREPHLLLMAYDITTRQRLERQILEISDREKARIGQDIHDGLCQELVSLAFDANSLEHRLSAQARPEAATARRIADFLDHAITEARQLSHGLFPIRLEGEGLPSALEELAKTTRDRFHLACSFQCEGTVAIPGKVWATHLYRIAQEAVTNAVKHGQPHRIALSLRALPRQLELKIVDDGIGLPRGASEKPAGMGLHIMDYRARSIGATLRLERCPDGGTTVCCCIPLAGGVKTSAL